MSFLPLHRTPMMDLPHWHLYMLRLPSGMLYTGITTDGAPPAQHQAGKGAKALRGKELTLAFHCRGDRSTALKLEYRVKQLSKNTKRAAGESPAAVVGVFASRLTDFITWFFLPRISKLPM